MQEIYEQIGSYLVTCIDDAKALDLMLEELMPLMKQVNYAALTADSLQEYTDKLGLGDQANLIVSNIVTIYQVNTGNHFSKLLSGLGLHDSVIKAIGNNLNYIWVPAGILLLGSGILANLRESYRESKERSNPNRT